MGISGIVILILLFTMIYHGLVVERMGKSMTVASFTNETGLLHINFPRPSSDDFSLECPAQIACKPTLR